MLLRELIHDPLTRFIAQMVAIIIVSRLLGLVVRRIGQPMVIAEITAGIILGPSLLGLFWPATTEVLFPVASLGHLQLVSQIGLILFMFLIGLELDPGLLRGRGAASVAISYASIVVPFGLGALLAWYIYPRWSSPQVKFSTFFLFCGVAMSITAFPVLARVLSERQLLRTRVGAVAITCAAVDDVTAWCLLAFVVAAARADGYAEAGMTTVLAVLYVLLMTLVIRPVLRRVADKVTTRAGLSQNVVAVVLLLLLFSSWTTELLGIHALFGAFVFGVVLPKEGGLAHSLAEKLEDLVIVMLLPLFFAYSGVRTQLSLLDSPEAWLTCGLIIIVATAGKFGGSFLAARLTGLSWRESGALGLLMNTRGLMELIALNIGLDLGVISPTVFTMMVVMALVTTFITSPLLALVYPPHVQTLDAAHGAPSGVEPSAPPSTPLTTFRPLVCVANEQSGPGLLKLAVWLSGAHKVRIQALHLVPATERASFYLEERDSARNHGDSVLLPLLSRASHLGISVDPLSFVSPSAADDICRVAATRNVDLVLLGWHKPVLRKSLLAGTVARVLRESSVPVGVYIERRQHEWRRILVPFVGTKFDRAALRMVERVASGETQLAITLLHVRSPNDRRSPDMMPEVLHEPTGSQVTLKVVYDDYPVDVAIAESKQGYDLVIVGLGREWGLHQPWFGMHSERLLSESDTSLLIVGGAIEDEPSNDE